MHNFHRYAYDAARLDAQNTSCSIYIRQQWINRRSHNEDSLFSVHNLESLSINLHLGFCFFCGSVRHLLFSYSSSPLFWRQVYLNVFYRVQKSHTRYHRHHLSVHTRQRRRWTLNTLNISHHSMFVVAEMCTWDCRVSRESDTYTRRPNGKQFILNLYTYINWYTRNGEHSRWWRFFGNESIKLFLLEIPSHRIQWSLWKRNQREWEGGREMRRAAKNRRRKLYLLGNLYFSLNATDQTEQATRASGESKTSSSALNMENSCGFFGIIKWKNADEDEHLPCSETQKRSSLSFFFLFIPNQLSRTSGSGLTNGDVRPAVYNTVTMTTIRQCVCARCKVANRHCNSTRFNFMKVFPLLHTKRKLLCFTANGLNFFVRTKFLQIIVPLMPPLLLLLQLRTNVVHVRCKEKRNVPDGLAWWQATHKITTVHKNTRWWRQPMMIAKREKNTHNTHTRNGTKQYCYIIQPFSLCNITLFCIYNADIAIVEQINCTNCCALSYEYMSASHH